MAAESDRKRKAVEKSSRKSVYLYNVAVDLIGLAIGIFHRWHVSTLFENDRHFSHLSEIEREMSFRTEMGMYYSYYKTIAEAKTFSDGMKRIIHDNISEYGNVINAARKYSLLPELIIGYLYHCAKNLGIISVEQCWQIERGKGVPPVTSCEGLGVPVYFYLEAVWISTMFTAAVLFYYSMYLGNNLKSGIIAVLLFFYNHNECTRVQWTPPLRETFGYPALLYQMYILTTILRVGTAQEQKVPKSLLQDMASGTVISLCFWQFSHFVLTTQIVALLILKWMRIISNDLYRCLSKVHGCCILIAMCVTDGVTLLYSLYLCLLLTSNILSLTERLSRFMGTKLQTVLEAVLTIACTKYLKSFCDTLSEDNAHVFNLLKAKLTGYKDFHTMLYTCSPEFDFLPYRSFETIIITLLLPSAILAGFLAVYFWYRNYKVKGYPRCIEADLAYNAGTVGASRYLEKLGLKSEITKTAIIVLLISAMSYHGLERLHHERSVMGEYSDIEQEELYDWIKKNTPEHAVFAGKMSLMANLMLSTGRPIVNNPYYESKEMRDRTMKVYEIFSRKDVSSVYFTLRNLQVGYVVLEEALCFGYANLQPGCQMLDLWDLVDNGTAKAAGKQPVCPTLFQGNAYPFKRAFVNNRYVVLQLDYSYYVELKPKTSLHYQS
ncbi:unnamed protein product [Xylocopa violacea]|uniref:Uncharacterized protein n=1 Tax=Xylocopa violacea TaxID=135666 RepID=A0ABP1MZ05_XYLVO